MHMRCPSKDELVCGWPLLPSKKENYKKEELVCGIPLRISPLVDT